MRRRFNPIVLFLMIAILTVIGFFGAYGARSTFADGLPFASDGVEFGLRAKFYTSYDSSVEERKHNIALAAAAIDGTLIEKGCQFSFNAVVGERTEARGYLPAKIILYGAFTDGIGGGVCQVSSTVYNAALLAGMTILEYHPHSLSVSYVEPSFDAMVNSAGSDLRFENQTAFPVLLRATADGARLTVFVYGAKTDRRFVRESKQVERIPAPPEQIRDALAGEYPDLKDGELRVLSYGRDGLKSVGILAEYKGERLISRKIIRKDTYLPLQGISVRGCA